jgi:hypothetical protein
MQAQHTKLHKVIEQWVHLAEVWPAVLGSPPMSADDHFCSHATCDSPRCMRATPKRGPALLRVLVGCECTLPGTSYHLGVLLNPARSAP